LFALSSAQEEPNECGYALYALDAFCYHAGGPLNEGDIEDIAVSGTTKKVVVCPWHHYRISLTDGQCFYQNLKREWSSKGVKQRSHSAWVDAATQRVWVSLSQTDSTADGGYDSDGDAQPCKHHGPSQGSVRSAPQPLPSDTYLKPAIVARFEDTECTGPEAGAGAGGPHQRPQQHPYLIDPPRLHSQRPPQQQAQQQRQRLPPPVPGQEQPQTAALAADGEPAGLASRIGGWLRRPWQRGPVSTIGGGYTPTPPPAVAATASDAGAPPHGAHPVRSGYVLAAAREQQQQQQQQGQRGHWQDPLHPPQ
jgi:nitrite reductase/ring-hydroxylating ferredoxin subunit